jgi:hypothetical protein
MTSIHLTGQVIAGIHERPGHRNNEARPDRLMGSTGSENFKTFPGSLKFLRARSRQGRKYFWRSNVRAGIFPA